MNRKNAILTNLDSGFPVIIGILFKGGGGHACVVDGYGYDLSSSASEPYYRVATGWSGKVTPLNGDAYWKKDYGAWSYNLSGVLSNSPSHDIVANDEIVYNMIYDLSTISSDSYVGGHIDFSSKGVTKPVIISGRLVKRKKVGEITPTPICNAHIEVSWNTSPKYSVKTNEKGIFACIVEANETAILRVTSPDVSFYAVPIIAGTVGENISGPSMPVANRWKGDRISLGIAASTGQYETSADQAAMFVSKGMPEGEKYVVISKDALATADLSYLGSGVLFIGSDPGFDFNGDYDADAVANVMQFVSGGGTVVTSGKSTAFPRLMGGSQGLRFYSFSGLPRPYGNSTSISTRVSAWAKHIKQNMHGQDTFSMASALPAKDHSLISDPGATSPFSIGSYIFESISWGPWGPELNYNLTYVPNGTAFDYGPNGGKVIYINGELSLNHAAGGLAKDYVDALIDPIIFKEEDEEKLAEAVGGEYGALGGKPVVMNSLNLKSVVYNNGVALNNITASDDVSFVFTVTDRIADSSAPELVVSDDAVPTLAVSLRNPSGEVVAAKRTPTSADNTLAFALSGDAAVAGEWKMTVEDVDGYDGRRVVVAAVITGAYDIGVSVALPASTGAQASRYPRGVDGDSFNYQLGDGCVTLSDANLRKLALGALVKPEALDFARIDDDLVVRIKGGLDKIKLPGWFKRMRTDFFEVTFAGGGKLSGREVKKLAVVREPEIDITPIAVSERVRGTGDDDDITGSPKNEFLFAGEGDDTVRGGGGDDVYYYRRGDGNDALILGDQKNVLRFHTGAAPEEVSVERDGEDMIFRLDGGSVRITDWFRGSKLTRIEFPDGTIWDDRDAEKLAAGKELAPREYRLAAPQAEQVESKPAAAGGGCNGGVPLLPMIFAAAALVCRRRRR